jgi:molecular chaperone DnaK
MKKLIPRNTTIPVRRSDIFSTGEDNQTMVEVHVVQGEREMATGNKSLGRFKLMGIPPAPRGIPQVQVAFDIDANGILQVTAMDRTTGREQSITVQGASNLSEDEVRQMIRNAEEFSQADRLRKEKVEKRNKAEASTFQAERLLREATLDFGMSFVSPYRTKIEPLVLRLRESLADNDDRGIDILSGNLRDAIADLNREVYQRNQEEAEEGGFFESIKNFFLDDEDDYDYDRRDNYDSWGTPRRDGYDSWNAPRREPTNWDTPPRRDPYDDRLPPRRDANPSWDTPRRDPYDRTPPRDPGPRDVPPRRDPYDDRTPRRDSSNSWDATPRRDPYDDRSAPDRDPYDDSPPPRRDPYEDRTSPRRNPEPDRATRRDSADSWSNPTPPPSPRENNWEEPPRRVGEVRRSAPDAYSRDPYDDRSSSVDRPRRPRADDDYPSGSRGGPPKRPTRPNYAQDNWDDEDDWV